MELLIVLSMFFVVTFTETTQNQKIEEVEIVSIPTTVTAKTTTTTEFAVIESGKRSSIAEIKRYFEKTGTTCCHVQTACGACRNYNEANGIQYCCPGCRGVTMMSNLICTCYAASPFNASLVNCKVNSSEIVGGYKVYRPSYYPNSSPIFTFNISFFILIYILYNTF